MELLEGGGDLHADMGSQIAGFDILSLKESDAEAYKEWSQYKAWRPLNIEGMYGQVNLHRRGN